MNLTNSYLAFQQQSLSPFHVVENLMEDYEELGFVELSFDKDWSLNAGSSYYLRHPDLKSLIAFRVGQRSPRDGGFKILSAHTDSPAFRLRLDPFKVKEGVSVLMTQKHGGMIFRSWFDRPLTIGGSVFIKSEKSKFLYPIDAQIVASSIPVGVIPDVAIHLDREKNQKGSINPELVMQAICGTSDMDAKEKLFGKETLGQWQLSMAMEKVLHLH